MTAFEVAQKIDISAVRTQHTLQSRRASLCPC